MPGQSGNPSGRPKRDEDLAVLARMYTEDAIAALVSIANDPTANASARISAANSLLDRGHGRPPQAVAVKTGSNDDAFLRVWRYLTVGRGSQSQRMSLTRSSPRHAKIRSRLLGMQSERLRRQASPRHSAKTYNPHSSPSWLVIRHARGGAAGRSTGTELENAIRHSKAPGQARADFGTSKTYQHG